MNKTDVGSAVAIFTSYHDLIELGTLKDVVKDTVDQSYHGSPWYYDIYTIQGDSGKLYKVNSGGNSYCAQLVTDAIKSCDYAILELQSQINDKENLKAKYQKYLSKNNGSGI